jgi:hypothetical protein
VFFSLGTGPAFIASLDAAPLRVLGDVKLRDLPMKRYLTLIVLVLASLPVFAAVDMSELASYDVGSIVMIAMGAVALVATRKLQQH